MIHQSLIPNDEARFRELKFKRRSWKHRDFPTDSVSTLRFVEWYKKFKTGNVLEVNFCYALRDDGEWGIYQTVCEIRNGSYSVPIVINNFDILQKVVEVLNP